MNRRDFVGLVGLVGSGAALRAVGGCASAPPSSSLSPRSSPAVAVGGFGPAPHPELEEASIPELAARLGRGELTSRGLVEGYAARIDALDRNGPALRSVLETNPEALSIAQALDAERKAGRVRGPLHGIPMLVKDNLDTGDRMQTTAGSLALVGSPAPRDAHVVARLRAAGVVLLGKTNLSEWANIRDTHATSGWSGRGGLTKNPYALDRNSSGSSSGSASAVAASLSAAAIGTETDGSIVSPSSMMALVGLKPTVGRVSRRGIIPIAHSQDTAGPMTRSVLEAALVLGAIAGPDPRDAATAGAPPVPDFTKGLVRDAARGRRIGAVRNLHWMLPDVEAAYERALADLRTLGAVIVDVEFPHSGELGDPELEVLLYELNANLAAYLEERAAPGLRTLDDVLRFDREHPSELGWFGQDLFERAAKKGPLMSPAYLTALATCRRLARDEGIDLALKTSALDALVAPTGNPAWLTDRLNGDSSSGGSSSLPAVAGYPSLTVPSGETHGLPLGLLFFGGAWSEPTLLQLGFAYEQATKHRRSPRFLPSVVF